MANGLFAIRKILRDKKRFKLKKNSTFIKVMESKPQAKGTVVKKFVVDAKNPSSGERKCVKIKLNHNKRLLNTFLPKDGATNFVNEHDIVLIEGQGGPLGKCIGDLPTVSTRVIKVGKYSLKELVRGKKQKI